MMMDLKLYRRSLQLIADNPNLKLDQVPDEILMVCMYGCMYGMIGKSQYLWVQDLLLNSYRASYQSDEHMAHNDLAYNLYNIKDYYQSWLTTYLVLEAIRRFAKEELGCSISIFKGSIIQL